MNEIIIYLIHGTRFYKKTVLLNKGGWQQEEIGRTDPPSRFALKNELGLDCLRVTR